MRICVLVNDTYNGPIALRARQLYALLPKDIKTHIQYRESSKPSAMASFMSNIRRILPDLVCVLNCGYPGVMAAVMAKSALKIPYILDIGDAGPELLRAMGVGYPGFMAARLIENIGQVRADAIIVRGELHKTHLEQKGLRNVFFVPDGVDTRLFRPMSTNEIRHGLGVNDEDILIGAVGSSFWSSKLNTCFGWELVEAIALSTDNRIRGILIGDGDGIDKLKNRAEVLCLGERMLFLGRVEYEKLPGMINACDILISTQTNDIVGKVRTTAKLPLYLACGKYVLCSNVGEASRILPDHMLIPYSGSKDLNYPIKLAERISELVASGEYKKHQDDLVNLARERYEYSKLVSRLDGIVRQTARGNFIAS